MALYRFLAYAGIAITVLIVILGTKRYHILPREMKYLYWFFVFDVTFSILGSILGKMSINNHWIGQFETPIMYGCYVWVLTAWIERPALRKIMLYSVPVIVLLWGVSSMNLEVWKTFDVFSFPLVYTLLLLQAMITLYFITQDTSLPIMLQSRFWVCVGLMLSCIGTIPALVFAKQLLIVSPDTLILVLIIRNFISIVAYSSYVVGFLFVRQQQIL